MQLKSLRPVLLLIMASSTFSSFGANANVDEEFQALLDRCTECHGTQGDAALPGWMPIGSMTEQEIIGKLTGHRAKLINDSTMSKVAHDLTDEQIKQIATYYANKQAADKKSQ